LDFPVHARRVLLDKVAGKQRDVLAPLAQGRNCHSEDGQQVVQVRPEPVLRDHGVQVPIGSGDDLDVDLDGAAAAHAWR